MTFHTPANEPLGGGGARCGTDSNRADQRAVLGVARPPAPEAAQSIGTESDFPGLVLRVRQDGVMVVHKDGEPTDQEFATLAEVFVFLRSQSRANDSRLRVFGFDGRKLIETTI